MIAKTRGGTGHGSAAVLVVGLCSSSGKFGRRLTCMASCRVGKMVVVVREHSGQLGRDAVALVEPASFPSGQVAADLETFRSSLRVQLREGPTCLARSVALACSHMIVPPWASPGPGGRRPTRLGEIYVHTSKTYEAVEQPATASAGR